MMSESTVPDSLSLLTSDFLGSCGVVLGRFWSPPPFFGSFLFGFFVEVVPLLAGLALSLVKLTPSFAVLPGCLRNRLSWSATSKTSATVVSITVSTTVCSPTEGAPFEHEGCLFEPEGCLLDSSGVKSSRHHRTESVTSGRAMPSDDRFRRNDSAMTNRRSTSSYDGGLYRLEDFLECILSRIWSASSFERLLSPILHERLRLDFCLEDWFPLDSLL